MIANIGKGVLYQLIGIQENSKKTVLEVNGLSKDSPLFQMSMDEGSHGQS